MNNTVKCIYGIINTESNAAGPRLFTANGTYAVPYLDVSAVVSDSGIIDYTNLSGAVAAQHLVQYQLVIEKVMRDFTVIPVRLGAYVDNEDEVMQVLNKGHRLFRTIFEKIEGRIEINVMASWVDFNMVIKEISEEEEIKTLRQSLANKKEGITVDDQMKMGMLIKGHLDRKKDECARSIWKSLKNLCRDMKEHTMPDDATIINAAFLVDNDMRIPFEERLDGLNDGFNGKVHFKCVGPLPPYNFYALDIKKLQFEEIDRARKELNLNTFASRDEMRRAYRRQASMYHPDRQSDAQSETERAETKMKFDEITKAYRLLSEYCRHENCSMKEEDFAQNAIIVKIKDQ
jgi:hypothetical protein